jgi:hypothetical protein
MNYEKTLKGDKSNNIYLPHVSIRNLGSNDLKCYMV